nr:hypothetical protein [Tanacetum cinerariifolium]
MGEVVKSLNTALQYQESAIPLNEIISQIPPSIAITPVLPIKDPEDSLIMGDEDLSTIPEKESYEFIKSSVKDLVPIPSESEDTSESYSEFELPACDYFSPINVPEGKFVTFFNPLFDSNDNVTSSDDESLSDEDIPEDNVGKFSNPLFEFNGEYVSSDVNPLFDEMLGNIENKDSYVSDLDELALLVTPLFDFNEDEYFDHGGDIDEIGTFLDTDVSTDSEDGYHDNDNLMTDDKVFYHGLSEFFFFISPIRWNLLFFSPPGVKILLLTPASSLFIYLL